MHGSERQYRLHGRPGPLDHLLRRPPTRTESNFGPPFWLILGPKIREIREISENSENRKNFGVEKFSKHFGIENFSKKIGIENFSKFFENFGIEKISKFFGIEIFSKFEKITLMACATTITKFYSY